jgi:hypothetical protein
MRRLVASPMRSRLLLSALLASLPAVLPADILGQRPAGAYDLALSCAA